MDMPEGVIGRGQCGHESFFSHPIFPKSCLTFKETLQNPVCNDSHFFSSGLEYKHTLPIMITVKLCIVEILSRPLYLFIQQLSQCGVHLSDNTIK